MLLEEVVKLSNDKITIINLNHPLISHDCKRIVEHP
jgi:hypothetical protein